MKKTIVVLYSNKFSDQSALSIADYIDKNYRDCNVVTIERNEFSNLGISRIVNGYTAFTARHLPAFNRLWTGIREKFITRRIAKSKQLRTVKKKKEDSFSNKYLKKFYKVDNIIIRFNPEVVICSSPYSFNRVMKAKQRLDSDTKVLALMSDYCLNKSFLRKYGDGYLVQNEIVKSSLVERGVPKEIINVIGTPIAESKLVKFDKAETKQELGINNDYPCILLSGGRQGSYYIRDSFYSLTRISEDINLICLSGGNTAYANYIKNYVKANDCKNVYLVEDEMADMSKLYSVTDIAVCSPSAATTYEVISRGIPLVLIKPINVIEKGNFSYLTASRIALRGVKKDEIITSVYSLLKEEDYRESIIARELEATDLQCASKASAYVYSYAEDCRQHRALIAENAYKKEEVNLEQIASVDESNVVQTTVENYGDEIINGEEEITAEVLENTNTQEVVNTKQKKKSKKGAK